MSIEVTTLDELNSTSVQERMDILATMLKEKYPHMDFSSGALNDILVYLMSILAEKTATELARYSMARSLKDIQENEGLADNDLVDGVLSNYNIERGDASYTTGAVTITFLRDLSVLIPEGTTFTVDDTVYTINEGVVVGSTSSENSERLEKVANDVYVYTIDVRAVEPGATPVVRKGCDFTTNLIDADKVVAACDFILGSNDESNASLMLRLKTGMATPCWGNRYQIEKMIKAEYPAVKHVSVVGFGDVEMSRDRITCFPISVGGCADVYIKTATTTISYPVYATRVRENGSIWQATIPSFAMSGCYRATEATLDGNVYPVISQEVIGGREGTADQVLLVQFEKDDLTPVFTDGRKNFEITLTGQVQIDGVNSLLHQKNLMPITVDAEVKTARPAWVDVTLDISGSISDESGIKSTITDLINNTGFDGAFYSSEVIRAISPQLDSTQKIQSINLTAEIWGLNNEVYRLTSPHSLNIPLAPENGVSRKTTVFYCRSVVINNS